MKNVKMIDPKKSEVNPAVMFLNKIQCMDNEGVKDFEWPSYTDENSRIKNNNIKYKGMTIVDAFYAEMGKKTPSKKLSTIEECRELKVGDIVPLHILNVTKKGVVFDNSVYKEDISSNVNLYQYKKMQEFTPKKPVMCKVISKVNNKVVVDPFVVMFDEWLNTKLMDTPKGKKMKKEQLNLSVNKSVKVKDLKLVYGGYIGKVIIPTISEFVGQNVYIDAFIPGSLITLNIESDFEKWNGKEVDAFIVNYINRGNSPDNMSVVCSVKDVLKFEGQKSMISIFANYTENNQAWQELKSQKMAGIVTGIINSSKKSGVFVELEGQNITGMVEMPSSELVSYKPFQKVDVSWSHFNEPLVYNKEVGQYQHVDPYVINNDILEEFNIKPIFQMA